MKRAWTYLCAMALLSLGSLGAVLVTVRVAAAPASQQAPAGPRQPAGDPDATIPDDREVAPDEQESADNNVTFPVDI